MAQRSLCCFFLFAPRYPAAGGMASSASFSSCSAFSAIFGRSSCVAHIIDGESSNSSMKLLVAREARTPVAAPKQGHASSTASKTEWISTEPRTYACCEGELLARKHLCNIKRWGC